MRQWAAVSGKWVAADKLDEHTKSFNKAELLASFLAADARVGPPPAHSVELAPWEKALAELEVTPLDDPAMVLREGAKRVSAFLKLENKTTTEASEVYERALVGLAAIPARGTAQALSAIHLQFGLLLEEHFHLIEREQMKWTPRDLTAADELADQGSESGREDDIKAVCKLHGCAPGAAISEVLVAIDAEYKALLASGESDRADYVQGLYAFKAAQAASGSNSDKGGASGGSKAMKHLGQALKKFKDAVAADASNLTAIMHVGRVMLGLGDYEGAQLWLKVLAQREPGNGYGRFLLGVAGLKVDPTSATMLALVQEGHQTLFTHRVQRQMGLLPPLATGLHASKGFALLDNTIVESFDLVCTVCALAGNSDAANATALRASALFADLLYAHRRRPRQNDADGPSSHYRALELGLVRAHSHLFNEAATPARAIVLGTNLIKLVKSLSGCQGEPEVSALLMGIARKGIELFPRKLDLLVTLGASLLSMYEGSMGRGFSPGTTQWTKANAILEDAERSFRAAISIEQMPEEGDVPEQVRQLSWWKPLPSPRGKRDAGGGKAPVRRGGKVTAASKSTAAPLSATLKAVGHSRASGSGRPSFLKGSPKPSANGGSGAKVLAAPPPTSGRRSVGAAVGGRAVLAKSGRRTRPDVSAACGAQSGRIVGQSSADRGAGAAAKPIAGRRARASPSDTVGAVSRTPPAGHRDVGVKAPPVAAKSGRGTQPAIGGRRATGAGKQGGGSRASSLSGEIALTQTAASGSGGGAKRLASHSGGDVAPAFDPQAKSNGNANEARLGLARVLRLKLADGRSSPDDGMVAEMVALFQTSIAANPRDHDPVIELAEFLIPKEPMKAVEVYNLFPCKDPPTFDDGYIHSEVVRILMKQKAYSDTRLERHLIGVGKVNGVNSIVKEIGILDEEFKFSKMLMRVYAGINGKDVSDESLQGFFKMKCWA
jgi:hypothetical protein